jgi:hypothetical protein
MKNGRSQSVHDSGFVAYFEGCDWVCSGHIGEVGAVPSFQSRISETYHWAGVPRLWVGVYSVATADLAGVFLPREVALVKKADAAGRRLKVATWASAGRVGVLQYHKGEATPPLSVADRASCKTRAIALVDEGHPCARVNSRERRPLGDGDSAAASIFEAYIRPSGVGEEGHHGRDKQQAFAKHWLSSK